MRILSENLQNAQNGHSVFPYVQVDIGTVTYTTIDTAGPRLLSVQDAVGISGANLLTIPAANGLPVPVSCIITLLLPQNASLFDTDFRGERVSVKWGYSGYLDTDNAVQSFTPEFIEQPPYYVVLQRNVQNPRRPLVELYCTSLWGLLDLSAWHDTPGIRLLTGNVHNRIRFVLDGFQFTSELGVVSIAGNTDPALNYAVNLNILFDTPRGELIRQLLSRTSTWLRFRGDGATPALVPYRNIDSPILDVQDDLIGHSYIYDNTGTNYQLFFEASYDRAPPLPNRVLAVKDITLNTSPSYSDRAHTVGIFGDNIDVLEVIEEPAITSQADAQTIVDSTIEQYEDRERQAEIVTQMNVGQEPADIIELRNTLFSSGIANRRGRAERLVRLYDAERRQYILIINLGKVNSYPTLYPPLEKSDIDTARLDFSRYAKMRRRHNREFVL